MVVKKGEQSSLTKFSTKSRTQNPIRLPKRRLVQKRPQLAQRTTEEEYKHQHNQHNEVIEKMTKRVEKSKKFDYSNYSIQIHYHGY